MPSPARSDPGLPGSRARRSSDGEQLLVTGSNIAPDAHPAWTANLLAHPDAAVSVHGVRIPVQATLVSDAEREAVWHTLE